MTTPYTEQATFFRAALLLGLVRGETVIDWADGIIHVETSPASTILDLALTPAGDLTAMRHALRPLADTTESPAIVHRLLVATAHDFATGGRNFGDTIRVLGQIRRLISVEPSMYAELGTLENSHMLAVAGVEGDVGALEDGLRSWLARFTE